MNDCLHSIERFTIKFAFKPNELVLLHWSAIRKLKYGSLCTSLQLSWKLNMTYDFGSVFVNGIMYLSIDVPRPNLKSVVSKERSSALTTDKQCYYFCTHQDHF